MSRSSLAHREHASLNDILGSHGTWITRVRWASPSLSRQQPWASSLPRQPIRQQQVRPVLPDGHLRFQFYVYGNDGKLVQEWMSLQDVQDLLLDNFVSLSPWRGPTYYSPAGSPLGRPARPEDGIQGIVATVQQVVSSEVAQKRQEPPTFPPNLTDQSAESMEIPEGILQNLFSFPQSLTTAATTQWHLPPTLTTPQTTSYLPTTFPWSVDTESTSDEPPATATNTDVITDMTTTSPDPDSVEDLVAVGSQIPSQNTKRPLTNDRWNSRFPVWSSQPEEVKDDDNSAALNHDPEPTVDYHSSPGWLSETVLPSSNEVTHDVGITTWNRFGDSGQESDEGMTTLKEESYDDSSSTVSASQATTAAAADDHRLTTKVDKEDHLLTTLTGLYAQSYASGNPSKFPSLTTLTIGSMQETTKTQPDLQTDAPTVSPFQSTYFDVATDFFLEDHQSTFTSEAPTTLAQTEAQTLTTVRMSPTVYFPTRADASSATDKVPEPEASSTTTDEPTDTPATTEPSQTAAAASDGPSNTQSITTTITFLALTSATHQNRRVLTISSQKMNRTLHIPRGIRTPSVASCIRTLVSVKHP
ncbi:uncharacterized protein [Panulirus ornatus]|uniref:uncharacterized protein n=1 Tax=Panulirus ornatus TaxID=150431 RepID=UPI003A89367F